MRWQWDEGKNHANRIKHKVGFETAMLVFDDPLALSRPDTYPYEERWQTIGLIGTVTVIVIHTALEMNLDTGEETGRIISARKATRHENEAYENKDF